MTGWPWPQLSRRGPEVPAWMRAVALLVGLAGWAVSVAAYLWQGQLPDALLLGVPAGLILALAPPLRKRDDADNAGSDSE